MDSVELFGITMNIWLIVWLVVAIVSLVIELATVGLVSIWITGGAIVALIFNLCGFDWLVQLLAFFVSTVVLLVATRPIAKKYVRKRGRSKSNYEELIGQEVRIIEEVDNRFDKGKANYKGMEWTARSLDENEHFQVDESAVVDHVEGVKLILRRD